jgi:NADPH:quinone reductase-like Zn-dependent oxidoreductase
MKVYEIQGAFGLDNLKIAERPDPKPGPGQVLIKTGACSVNYRDLLMVNGMYNPKQPLPLIPLSDGVGQVTAIGDGVKRVQVGDRVAGIFAQKWLSGGYSSGARSSTLGGPLDGMLAEYVVLDAAGVVKLPEHLSDEEAACLPCAALTAWNALMVQGNIQPGQTVLLLGTGGVSIFGLQFAKAAGARVIITSSSDEKLERAKVLGADHVINYKTEPKWDKQVRKLTNGLGADCVVEVGGADTFNKSVNAVSFGGMVAVIGILGGVGTEIMLTSILMKAVRVHGILVGHREMFEDMNRAVTVNQLKPVIDKSFPFEQAPEAFAMMGSAKHFGKIVIKL